VAAQTALYQEYNDQIRPMVRKILRSENQRAVGMVYPIACPYEDLLFSGFGVKLQDAPIFPRYISVLVRAEDEEPTIKKSGTGDDEVFMMQHTKVIAVAAKNPKPFSVEAFCQRNKRAISTWQITKCICWWERFPQTIKVPT